jgi:hypothetical protein
MKPMLATRSNHLPLLPRECVGEGGARRRMRAGAHSAPVSKPHHRSLRLAALIHPSGTFLPLTRAKGIAVANPQSGGYRTRTCQSEWRPTRDAPRLSRRDRVSVEILPTTRPASSSTTTQRWRTRPHPEASRLVKTDPGYSKEQAYVILGCAPRRRPDRRRGRYPQCLRRRNLNQLPRARGTARRVLRGSAPGIRRK